MSTLKLPYGLKDGVPTHIGDVLQGLACDCACPICNSRLVAKKGNKRVHHFAHYSDAAPECKWATESLLHLKAKEILQAERRVWLPAVIVQIGASDHRISDAEWFYFDDVHVEKRLGEIRPDLMVKAGSQELLIEIAVHHFCDEPKIAKIRQRSISAIEIDLSEVDLFGDQDTIRDGVLQTAPRNWLFNIEGKRLMEQEVARLAAAGTNLVPSDRNRQIKQFHDRDFARHATQRSFQAIESGRIANPRLQSTVMIETAKAKLKNPDKWLDTPHIDLGNRTPRQAAMTESDHDIGMIDFLIGQASRRGY